MSKVKLTDYVVEFLQKKGIHDFFGYQGTMIAHLVDSIEKNPHVLQAFVSRAFRRSIWFPWQSR